MDLTRDHITEIDAAIRKALDTRRDHRTAIANNASDAALMRAQEAKIDAFDKLFPLLELYWPDIRDRVGWTFPSELVFPRKDF